MSYDDVLELPLKVFTLYNGNINRLRAEEDTRALRIQVAVAGENMVRETYDSLIEEMGTTIEFENEEYVAMEEGAFEKLLSLQKAK